MSSVNFLEKLLAGVTVEWKALWEVTVWDKKFNAVARNKQPKTINYTYLLAVDLFKLEKEGGNVFLLSTGEKTGWTTEELAGENLREGEVVAIPWGKSRPLSEVLKYYKGKFVTADNRIATSNNTKILLNKYLYYWLLHQSKNIDSFYRGAGIQHPSMAAILDMQIPIPTLEIQAEIVRILDAMTAHTAELTAELTARKKQYNYYRDKLLSFEDGEVEWERLGDIIYSLKTGLNPRQNFQLNTLDSKAYYVTVREIQNGKITFLEKTDRINERALNLINGRSNLDTGDVLFSGTGTVGRTAVIEYKPENWNIKEGVYVIKPIQEKILPRYLAHLLNSSEIVKEYSKKIVGNPVVSLPMGDLRNLKIPVPRLDKQARIVATLDKFDALTTSITEGLPREIALRQKQYTYYRDLLLSFPKPPTI